MKIKIQPLVFEPNVIYLPDPTPQKITPARHRRVVPPAMKTERSFSAISLAPKKTAAIKSLTAKDQAILQEMFQTYDAPD